MDRNLFLTIIFLFLIVSDCCSAWGLRKLIGVAPNNTSPAINVSPLPSPNSSGKESKASPTDGDKSGGKNSKDPESLNDSPKVNPKVSKSDDHDNTTSTNPSTQKEKGNVQNREEKNDGKTDSQVGSNRSCEGSTNNCSVQKTLVACLQGLDGGSKDLVILIQNKGESTMEVNITITTSLKKVMKDHEIPFMIPKHQTKGINVSLAIGQGTPTQIVMNAGTKECNIPMGPHLSKENFLQRLPSYYKQVTPIYGAYLLFLIALIVGGTWACCKFTKRGRHDGVPYQELEMGLPESASAVNVEAAEVWDEGWDDDWDEDKAVKSPGGRHVGSISASGLTSRSSNRDGWEKDWDD